MMTGEFFAYPLIFIVFIVLAIKLREYASELKEKHLKLLQFYLDRKFIYTVVTNSLKAQNNQQYSVEFICKVKEYFQLEEVAIVKYDSLKNNDQLSSVFKEELENIISDCVKKDSPLHTPYIILDPVEIANHKYRLYIYFSCKKPRGNNQESIVYIKKKFNHFSNDEIFTLDTCIHIFRKNFPA